MKTVIIIILNGDTKLSTQGKVFLADKTYAPRLLILKTTCKQVNPVARRAYNASSLYKGI